MTLGTTGQAEQATQAYVADLVGRLKRLPQVQRVLVESDGGAPRVWVVIKAKPFEFALRRPVYDAELQAMIAHPGIQAEFRLINAAEYRDIPLDQVLPPDDTVLYQR